MSGRMPRPSARDSLFSKKKGDGYIKAQSQNVKKSRVYVFGDADMQDDETVEFEMSDVRSRKGPKPTVVEKEPVYFEREITEGDSLQSMALQYGCSISELKRVNNIIKDQEFFGRRVIKVPLKRHSLMSELVGQENGNKKNSDHELHNGMTVIDETCEYPHRKRYLMDDVDNESSCNLSDPETQNLIIRTLSIGEAVHSQSQEARTFLENMDKDLSKIRDSSPANRRSLDEVVSLLTDRTIAPFSQKSAKKKYGGDYGLTWRKAVISMVVIFVVVPCIFLALKYTGVL